MRYRLHSALGGGEYDDAGDRTIGTVGFQFDGIEGLVYLPRKVLTEVKPPLPPEPPVGSVVLVGADPAHDARSGLVSGLVSRRYGAGWSTPGDDSGEFATWTEVCDGGPPVLLVPDPLAEAPELPWDPQPLDPDHPEATRTEVRIRHGWIEDTNQVGRTANTIRLTRDDACAKGLALLRAAAQQEAND